MTRARRVPPGGRGRAGPQRATPDVRYYPVGWGPALVFVFPLVAGGGGISAPRPPATAPHPTAYQLSYLTDPTAYRLRFT